MNFPILSVSKRTKVPKIYIQEGENINLMHQANGTEPSGRKGIRADHDTEDLGRRSTSRKQKREISRCPRPILPISQLYKLSDIGKGPQLVLLEEQKPKMTLLQTTLTKLLSEISKKHCGPFENGQVQ